MAMTNDEYDDDYEHDYEHEHDADDECGRVQGIELERRS